MQKRGLGGLVIVAVLLFIGVAVWWLESRFGRTTAIIVIGGLLGVICFAGGALLSAAISRGTLQNAAQFHQSTAMTEKYRQLAMREHVRSEREAFNARAKLDVLDAKRVDALAQQRAGLLTDLERQRWEQQAAARPTAASWAVDEDAGAGSFSEWE